ncbi:hypothetical protein ACQJBY_060751 [Aegilops geniculata]
MWLPPPLAPFSRPPLRPLARRRRHGLPCRLSPAPTVSPIAAHSIPSAHGFRGIPSRAPPLLLSLFPQVLDLEGERQIRPNRRCRRGMIEAATSTRLLPCIGGGIGEERSSSHSRRGAGEREQQQPQQEAVLMKRWSMPSPPLSSSGRRSSQDESTTPQRETTMGHGAEDVLLKTISVWFSSHFPCDLKLIQTGALIADGVLQLPAVSSRWRGCGRIPINFSCMWSVSNYTGQRTSFSFLLLGLPPSCLLCGC